VLVKLILSTADLSRHWPGAAAWRLPWSPVRLPPRPVVLVLRNHPAALAYYHVDHRTETTSGSSEPELRKLMLACVAGSDTAIRSTPNPGEPPIASYFKDGWLGGRTSLMQRICSGDSHFHLYHRHRTIMHNRSHRGLWTPNTGSLITSAGRELGAGFHLT